MMMVITIECRGRPDIRLAAELPVVATAAERVIRGLVARGEPATVDYTEGTEADCENLKFYLTDLIRELQHGPRPQHLDFVRGKEVVPKRKVQ